jgi:hypothetical protein
MLLESKQELQTELQKIKDWEKDMSGLWFWEKLTRLPFKVLDKLTPAFVHKKIGVLLDELGSYIQTGGKYLTSEKQMYKSIHKHTGTPVESYEDITALDVKDMNEISQKLITRRSKVASVQGATTGIGGIFTLAIDIPALLGMSLKTLQELAMIHGYDPNDKNERVFIVKCLQFSSADVVGKKAILSELATYYNREEHSKEMMSQLQGWREVVYTYRDNFGWKKLFQMIPVAGLIFGAFTNRSMINDVGEAGRMLYQKRRIVERLEKYDEVVE